MNSGMRKIFVTAIVAVLLLSGLVFLTNLSGQSKADNTWIRGLVTKCANNTPVDGATVTLTQVHTMTPKTGFTTGAGTYVFSPLDASMYMVKVEKSGYFSKETNPFRFDGTKNVTVPLICLDKMPVKDLTLEGTIGTNPIAVNDESVTFAYTHKANHEVNDFWIQNTTSKLYYVNLTDKYTPLVNDGEIEVWWNTTPDNLQQEPTDYEVVDYWKGIIEIKNKTINDWLDIDRNAGHLRMKYNHAATTANFANKPVAYNTVEISKNGSLWPSTDNYEIDYGAGTITILGNFVFGVDSITVNYTYYEPVMNAKLVLHNNTYDQTIKELETNDGTFSFAVWAGGFELSCESKDYEKFVDPNLAISDSMKMTILLDGSIHVYGWANNTMGAPAEGNLRAYLFSYDSGLPMSKRLIVANVSENYFEFDAYPDNYLLIVDADGYKATAMQITVPGASPLFIVLDDSDEEKYNTDITFISDDWNNLTVYRNITLNNDSRIFGMDYDDLRNAQLQIDLALGNGDGTLTALEFSDFVTWVTNRGPEYVTYEEYMTINSRDYISWYNSVPPCETVYTVSAQRTNDIIYIYTETKYTTNFTDFTTGNIGSGEVPLDEQTYFLNITMKKDMSTDVYRNYSYTVRLPRASDGNYYELNLPDSFISDNVAVDGFVDVDIDPSDLASQPHAELRIEKSLNGTARAKVKGPEGKFYVLNSSFDNYEAIVAMNENIEFSAIDSTDPNQRGLVGANFTWYFEWPSVAPATVGYGMEPTHKYVNNGEYTVKLDLTEAGGNLTSRDITVKVDDAKPFAKITVDDHTLVSGVLTINQSKVIKLNGSASYDYIFLTEPGEIDEWRWFWKDTSNESINATQLGKIWELSFGNPGTYQVTLNVTDSVGLISPDTNITIIVKDIEPPEPSFKKIRNGTWELAEPLTENEIYWFDASATTDNYDDTDDLTFNWTFPNGVNKLGKNVSHVFTDIGTFNVTLNVTDMAGNSLDVTQSVVVSANVSARPDLWVREGTFKASPSNPEEGQSVTLSVNITNKKDRAVANNVQVEFTAIIEGEESVISGTPTFYNSDGTQTTDTIQPNETVTVKITWIPSRMGNFTIKITANSTKEHNLIDNTVTGYVNVNEAGWKRILIYVLIIGVPIIIFLLIYLRRKYKRGELFKGREEEEDERPRGRKRSRGKETSSKKRRLFGRGEEED